MGCEGVKVMEAYQAHGDVVPAQRLVVQFLDLRKTKFSVSARACL